MQDRYYIKLYCYLRCNKAVWHEGLWRDGYLRVSFSVEVATCPNCLLNNYITSWLTMVPHTCNQCSGDQRQVGFWVQNQSGLLLSKFQNSQRNIIRESLSQKKKKEGQWGGSFWDIPWMLYISSLQNLLFSRNPHYLGSVLHLLLWPLYQQAALAYSSCFPPKVSENLPLWIHSFLLTKHFFLSQ